MSLQNLSSSQKLETKQTLTSSQATPLDSSDLNEVEIDQTVII